MTADSTGAVAEAQGVAQLVGGGEAYLGSLGGGCDCVASVTIG
jgi:hypothetical protein